MTNKRSKGCLRLTKFLKLMSTGTYYQGIYFKSKSYYSSVFGGLISILAFGILVSYSAYVL